MKKLLLILVMLLFAASAYSQEGGCYQRTRSKGIAFYNKGDMENAERAFRQAQNCADKPENNDLDEWIKKVGGDKLGLSHSSIVFMPEGNTVEVGVFGAHGNIEVTNVPGWCTYEKVINNNDSYIVITSFTNDTKYSRSGTITVKSDRKTAMLNVSQGVVQKTGGNNTDVGGGGDEPVYNDEKPFRIAFRAGINKPSFKVKSANVLTSVMDYGQSDVSGLENAETPNYKSSVGLQLEMLMDIRLSKHFYIETGLSYSNMKITNTFSSHDRLTYTLTYSGYYDIYYFDYYYKEEYKMNYLSIPILVNYKMQLAKKVFLDLHTGFIVGYGISGKLNLNGTVDYEMYRSTVPDEYWYAYSNVSGEVDLFSTSYDLQQNYSTGSCPQYNIKGNSNAAPFNRMNFSWDIGADFELGVFEIGLHYSLGLSNIANDAYWTSGDRVCGLLLSGEMIKSYAKIQDYSHKLSSFNVLVGVKF